MLKYNKTTENQPRLSTDCYSLHGQSPFYEFSPICCVNATYALVIFNEASALGSIVSDNIYRIDHAR